MIKRILYHQNFHPWVRMILMLSKSDTRQLQSLRWDQEQNLIMLWLKKMATQGQLNVKVKEGYGFLYNFDNDTDAE